MQTIIKCVSILPVHVQMFVSILNERCSRIKAFKAGNRAVNNYQLSPDQIFCWI